MHHNIMVSLGILRQSDTPELSSSGQFDLLAIEIIENIFSCLPGRDLITSLRLNKTLNIVILNSTELQYRVALCAYGMVDGHSSMSTKDKLAELLRREKSWRTLDFTQQNREPDQCRMTKIYGFQDGALVGYHKEDFWRLNNLLNSDWNLRVYDFASSQDGIASYEDEDRYLSVEPYDGGRMLAAGLAIQEHDLMCFVQVQPGELEEDNDTIIIDFRQFSTRQYHPHAEAARMFTEYFAHDLYDVSAQVEILGPWLMMLLSERGESGELFLVHWSSGMVVLREKFTSRNFGRFAFIAQDLLLFPRPVHMALELIRLPDPTRLDNITVTGFERIARFLLPGSSLFEIDCRTPNPLGTPQAESLWSTVSSSSASHSYRQYPFTPDPELAIILIRIKPFEGSEKTDLVVRRKILIEYALDCASENVGIDYAMNIPWKHWTFDMMKGSMVRWCSSGELVERLHVTTFGQKVVTMGTMTAGLLVVEDFNPYTNWRAQVESTLLMSIERRHHRDVRIYQRHEGSRDPLWKDECTIMAYSYYQVIDTESTLLVDDTMFPGSDVDLQGRLPYVRTFRKLQGEDVSLSVYTDGERLIWMYWGDDFDDQIEQGETFIVLDV